MGIKFPTVTLYLAIFLLFYMWQRIVKLSPKIKLSSCAKCMEMSTKFMINCIDVPTFR